MVTEAELFQEGGRGRQLGRETPFFVAGPGSAEDTPRRAPLEDPCISRNQAAIWWSEQRLQFEVQPSPHARLPLRALLPLPRVAGGPPQPPYQQIDVLERTCLSPGAMLMLGNRFLLLLSYRRADPPPSYGMVGQSEALEDLRRHIRAIGRFSETVLLLGEIGSGKEMVARALHEASGQQGPFEAVNMSNLSTSLGESDLFGHERGAFTDARERRVGAFERAQHGTLFLDEIRDVPLDIQSRLLRALEHRTYQSVGGQSPRQLNARVVAASNRSLTQAVAQGEFRQDLLDRLRALTITVPPLRDRREDIPLLLVAFLRAQTAQHPELRRFWPSELSNESPPLPLSFVLELMARPWIGNVRELLNHVNELAVANLNARGFVRPSDFNDGFLEETPAPAPAPARSTTPAPAAAPPVMGREELLAILDEHQFNQTHAAAALGISRQTLIQRMSRANIRRPVQITQEEIIQAIHAHRGDLHAAAQQLCISLRGLSLRMGQLGLDAEGR